MARSLNRVELIGNLGQDPELRNTPQGSSVCTLKVATSESYKDKNSGEWKDVTDWHRVVLWDNLAEYASKNLKKGSKIFTEGKIKTRNYEDKEGINRYITEIVANSLIILDPRTSNQEMKTESTPAATDRYTPTEEDDGDDIPF